MSKHGMLILAALAALLLAAGPSVAGDGVDALAAAADQGGAKTLKAVEVSTDSGGHHVVTLSGDGALTYESQVLEQPSRLVLDLPGVVSRLATRQIPVGKGGVNRVRAAQYRGDPDPVSRVVFDLDENVPYRIERQGSNLVVAFDTGMSGTPAAPEPAREQAKAAAPEAGVSAAKETPVGRRQSALQISLAYRAYSCTTGRP